MITEIEFKEVFNIMDSSFPAVEIRNFEGQKALCTHPCYRIVHKKDSKGKIIGFIAYWEFPEFGFVEHLAVESYLRGSGIGAELLSNYQHEYKGPIFLEVEPPVNDLNKRRIEFYKRLGFHFNDFLYYQMPLKPGDDKERLNIMSYPHPMAEAEFKPIKKIIYKEIYNVNE